MGKIDLFTWPVVSILSVDISNYDVQVLTQLTSLYQDLRSGYATADAIISLQSIFSSHYSFLINVVVDFGFLLVFAFISWTIHFS